MILMTNGCSYTEGYHLPDTQLSWPSVLGGKINFDVKNLALGGASNARIFRTTIEYFNTNSADVVIIGWTVQDRSELTHRDGLRLRLTSKFCLPDSDELKLDFSPIHKFWATELYNQYLNYHSWIHSIIHLQNYFEYKQIKYFFFTALGNNYIYDFLNRTDQALKLADQAWKLRDNSLFIPSKDKHIQFLELEKLVNQVNLDRWIGEAKYNMRDYLADKGFEMDQTGHYQADGHAHWANHLQEYLA